MLIFFIINILILLAWFKKHVCILFEEVKIKNNKQTNKQKISVIEILP